MAQTQETVTQDDCEAEITDRVARFELVASMKYGMFGLDESRVKALALNHEGATQWFSPEQTVELLKDRNGGAIIIDDKPYCIARTDLHHQVHRSLSRGACGVCGLGNPVYGSVIVGDTLYLIDSLTDG